MHCGHLSEPDELNLRALEKHVSAKQAPVGASRGHPDLPFQRLFYSRWGLQPIQATSGSQPFSFPTGRAEVPIVCLLIWILALFHLLKITGITTYLPQ